MRTLASARRPSMRPYSIDLRSRIVHAYFAQEGSQADLAQRFQVSERWLQNLLRQQRETGSIEPAPHGGGRTRSVGVGQEALLVHVLAETPAAGLDGLRGRCGVNGRRIWQARALGRVYGTRNKKACCA